MVSIITIFLNAENFIKEAIESVLAQTYKDWELLLIDDGSTDGSTAVARNYAYLYPEKIYFLEHENHQNLGKSTSRNLGIQNARGEYLTFLDADDVFLSQKLEKQVRILEFHPDAAMVYGRTEYWYSWKGSPKNRNIDFISHLGVQPHTLFNPPKLLLKFLSFGDVAPCICAIMVRRQTVINAGGFEENIQHMYEDQVLLAKICLESYVYVEDGCWERYRQHQNSSSNMAIKDGNYHPVWPNVARLNFLVWLATYIDRKKIQDATLRRILQKELWLYRHPIIHRLIIPVQFVSAYAKKIFLLFL